ncbi:hypothetical protein SO802_026367 [Lithocarpus litseifolius]|uniref:Uncharacterized protein n=1 Tax=Lithocarpus litseifolius TaxID=425828 RepID=A0AAW2C221_9ROSI
MPEGPKTVAYPTIPTTLVFAVPAAPTPMGLSNFLTLVLSLIKNFVVAFISFLRIFLMGLCCALCSFSGLSSIEVAPTSQFKISSSFATIPYPVSEGAAFFTHLTKLRPTTLTCRTSGVLDLLMLIYMAFGYLRSVSPVWRRSTVATEILCKDSFLVVL